MPSLFNFLASHLLSILDIPITDPVTSLYLVSVLPTIVTTKEKLILQSHIPDTVKDPIRFLKLFYILMPTSKSDPIPKHRLARIGDAVYQEFDECDRRITCAELANLPIDAIPQRDFYEFLPYSSHCRLNASKGKKSLSPMNTFPLVSTESPPVKADSLQEEAKLFKKFSNVPLERQMPKKRKRPSHILFAPTSNNASQTNVVDFVELELEFEGMVDGKLEDTHKIEFESKAAPVLRPQQILEPPHCAIPERSPTFEFPLVDIDIAMIETMESRFKAVTRLSIDLMEVLTEVVAGMRESFQSQSMRKRGRPRKGENFSSHADSAFLAKKLYHLGVKPDWTTPYIIVSPKSLKLMELRSSRESGVFGTLRQNPSHYDNSPQRKRSRKPASMHRSASPFISTTSSTETCASQTMAILPRPLLPDLSLLRAPTGFKWKYAPYQFDPSDWIGLKADTDSEDPAN